jgi:hypothetical protein
MLVPRAAHTTLDLEKAIRLITVRDQEPLMEALEDMEVRRYVTMSKKLSALRLTLCHTTLGTRLDMRGQEEPVETSFTPQVELVEEWFGSQLLIL